MKKTILLLLVIAFGSQVNAQKLWKDEVDDFTGDTKKFTNYYNVASTKNGTLKVSALRINKSEYIKMKCTSDLGCAGASDNYVMFIFTDGTKLELSKDLADIDCADAAPSLFNIKANSPLKTKTIEKIRFRQSKYYTDGTTSGTYSMSEIINATM